MVIEKWDASLAHMLVMTKVNQMEKASGT
jgi:hypothetical protein